MFPPPSVLAHIALLALAIPFGVEAQLYTWRDPQGSITIKSSPPPWYDDSGWTRGPRVQVLRNKAVVDDTAWSAEKRQDTRNKINAEEFKRMQAERAAAVKKPQARKAEDDD